MVEGKITETCCVCGGPLDLENVATCRRCGKEFHLAWSDPPQVENCGRWVVNERSCGIMFLCALCEQSTS